MRHLVLAAIVFGATLAGTTLGFGSGAARAAVVHYRPSHPLTMSYRTAARGNSVRPFAAGYYEGTMRLTFYPDGTVQGNFLPDGGNPQPVSGGLQNDGSLWLQIGIEGKVRFDGRLHQGGWLAGTLYGPRVDELSFYGVPQKTRPN